MEFSSFPWPEAATLAIGNEGVAEKRDSLKEFVKWCLTDGQQYNEQLGYIRLPPAVARRALEALAEIQ